RFLPIIRTFAPFVAGVAQITYLHFPPYNAVGALLWATLFLYGGSFSGNLPAIQHNFSLVIVAITATSLVPIVVEWVRARKARAAAARAPEGSVEREIVLSTEQTEE